MSQDSSPNEIDRAAEPQNSESDKLRALDRWTWITAMFGALALLVLVGIAVWGVLRDFADIKSTLLQSEISRLRSHAVRSVLSLQDKLSRQSSKSVDWQGIGEMRFLRRHWGNAMAGDPVRMYSAIISADRTVLVHSDTKFEGRKVTTPFKQTDADDDVFETHDPALTGGLAALDISLPIMLRDKQVGSYHTGLSVVDFDKLVAGMQREAMLRWAVVLTVAVAAGLAAVVSFYNVTKRITLVRQAIRLADIRRLAELGQLVGAIAHEIRNPLNAMRLNLHVLERSHQRSATEGVDPVQAASGECEPVALIEETNVQIHRIEELIRVLLAYARPDQAVRRRVDLCKELPAVIDLLRQSMAREQVSLELKLPAEPVCVEIDPTRLRRIILNLVSNAKDAAGTFGHIAIVLKHEPSHVTLEVCDDGPGVPDAECERVFDPFYTTKELAAGLGLSLVKRFMAEAGGTVQCLTNSPHGACFRLQFPNSTEEPRSQPAGLQHGSPVTA